MRAVVLTGTGDRAFCAGMDLREFAGGDDRGPAAATEPGGLQPFADGEAGVPVIGAANATAVAGGFELLLGCDVIVAVGGAPGSACPRSSAGCSRRAAGRSSAPRSRWASRWS